jgi:hypothetical protein
MRAGISDGFKRLFDILGPSGFIRKNISGRQQVATGPFGEQTSRVIRDITS